MIEGVLPVNDPQRFMEILHGMGNLRYNVSAHVFAQRGKLDYLVVEFTARAKLQNHIVKLTGFKGVDQSNHIVVIEFACDVNLFG